MPFYARICVSPFLGLSLVPFVRGLNPRTVLSVPGFHLGLLHIIFTNFVLLWLCIYRGLVNFIVILVLMFSLLFINPVYVFLCFGILCSLYAQST